MLENDLQQCQSWGSRIPEDGVASDDLQVGWADVMCTSQFHTFILQSTFCVEINPLENSLLVRKQKAKQPSTKATSVPLSTLVIVKGDDFKER